MRPLTLTIDGLRSFRSPVEISFEGRDHLAIIGDTGAGKSSILEAMTYALFGRTTYTGHANQEIINDLAGHMRVSLHFAVAGRTYEVTRALRRERDRTVRPAKASLIEFDADGAEVRRIEMVSHVNVRIQQLLGLDADGFLRTVILPQGQFAQLLVDDNPADRARILRQVWRTDELARAGELADEVMPEIREVAARVTQTLAGTPADPAAHLEQLQTVADRLTETAERSGKAHRTAVTARDTLRDADERIAIAENLLGEMDAFDFDAAVAAAEEIVRNAIDIRAERAAAQKGEQTLRQRMDAVPSDEDGLDGHAIGIARSALDDLPSRVDHARNAAAAARNAADELAESQRRLAEFEEELQDLERQLAGRAEERQHIASRLTTAEDELDEARRLLHNASQDAAEASNLQAQGDEMNAAAEQLEAEVGGLNDDLVEAERRAASAEASYNDAQHRNAAARAAVGLLPGSDCSVCGQPLPHDWQPPVAADLDTARDAHRSAQATLTELQRKADGLKFNARAAAAQAAELQTRTEERLERVRATVGRLAQLTQLPAIDVTTLSPLPAHTPIEELHADVLKPLSVAVVTARHELDSHDAESQQLGERRATAKANVTNERGSLERIRIRASQSLKDARAAAEALRKTLTSLPDLLRIEVALPDHPITIEAVRLDGLDTAHQMLDARAQELDRRAQLRNQLRTDLDRIHERLTDLDGRTKDRVVDPGNQVIASLNTHRDVLSRTVERLNIRDVALQPAASLADPEKLVETVRALRKTSDLIVQRVEHLIKNTKQDAETARQAIVQVAAELDIQEKDSPGADPEQVVALAGDLAAETDVAARAARRSADDFARLVDPLSLLQQANEELTAAYKVLTDLSAALKPGAFPKWLTLRRSRALLVHASLLLEQMSGGRYAFAELTDETAEWRIVDNDSGLARSPASLSGGEKFIASLALALGMVEMMARSGGRLESLWLDEGFGALDRSNLDAAIDALAAVAARGRMVAVISHIRAVAEQVNDVLSVTREATGSKARWLNPAQRAQLATSDLNSETASALSGLVD